MINKKHLARKIFDHLVEKGAELGSVSIFLIESVLDKEIKHEHPQRIYEYSGQDVNMIIQAPDITQAYQMLREKLQAEDLEHDDEDIGIDQLIDITSTEAGVIAFFDHRSAF